MSDNNFLREYSIEISTYNNIFLGYVPANISAAIAAMLGDKLQIICAISEIDMINPLQKKSVKIQIYQFEAIADS
jgi:hypothetical protein